MSAELRILIIDDSETAAKLLVRELEGAGHAVESARVDDEQAMRAALARTRWDVVISDWSLPRFSGPAALATLRDAGFDIPFIIVSEAIGEKPVVEALRSGAHDFILKGELARLASAVERGLREAKSRTAQRDAERALRVSEARYRRIIETTKQGVWILDAQAKTTFVSPGMARMLGTKASAVLGRRISDFISPEFQPAFEQQMAERRRGKGAEYETRFLREDGSTPWMLIEARPIYGDSGQFEGSLGMALDITERKRAEEALRASEEQVRLLLDSTGEAIYGIDLDGNCTFANAACVRMLGCRDRSELLGKHMHALIHHTKKDGTPYPVDDCQIYQAGLKGNGAAVDDEVLWRLDGTQFAVEHRSFPLWRGDKRIGAVISFVDVSARRQAEEALRSSEEQLRQAQKMEAIGQLTGGIAHDFNNMLAVILSSASFLARGLAAADPRREDVEEITLAAERAASLTRQLLAFSRKQVLEPRLLDLNQVIGNLEKMLRRLVGENIEVATVLPSGLGTIKADAGQLEQVIINLAVNARDAMRGGGKLQIETANVELDGSDPNKPACVQPGIYLLLAVSDTGIGMDAATQQRIFEPFFTTKEKGKGTGLGLSTCYGIVKQSGGYILVDSEPGHGTVFKVYLPRVSDVL